MKISLNHLQFKKKSLIFFPMGNVSKKQYMVCIYPNSWNDFLEFYNLPVFLSHGPRECESQWQTDISSAAVSCSFKIIFLSNKEVRVCLRLFFQLACKPENKADM